MKYGLQQHTIEKIVGVLSNHNNIHEAILYGSRAMDSYQNGSDIDMTLKGDLSFNDLLRIESQLDDLLLPYKMDLSIYQNITNPKLLAHISRVGKIFYRRTKVILQ